MDLNGLENLIRQEKDKHFDLSFAFSYSTMLDGRYRKNSAFLPELIGGSADLSGSNNTKQIISKIINSKISMEIIFITELENMVWQQL